MKNNDFQTIKKSLTHLFLIALSLLLISCSATNDEENAAYITLSFNKQSSDQANNRLDKSNGISSRALDNAKLNIDSLIITISQQGLESPIAQVDVQQDKQTSIQVPSNTTLSIVGEAFNNNILLYRGELTELILRAGERKALQLPLGNMILIDIGIDNVLSNGERARGIAFSRENQFILFSSDANNLVADEINNSSVDLYLRDLANKSTSNVNAKQIGDSSLASNVSEADISADGLYVVFVSDYTGFFPEDTNEVQDVFLKNTLTNTIQHISTGLAGELLNSKSSYPQISDDASVIAFFNPGATSNNRQGIYLFDRLENETRFIIASTSNYALSGDGQSILFINHNYTLSHYVISTQQKTVIANNVDGAIFRLNQNGNFIIFSILYKVSEAREELNGFSRALNQSNIETGQLYRYALTTGIYDRLSQDNDDNKLTGLLDTSPPNISNDGNYVVFSYDGRVFVRDVTNNVLSNIAQGNTVFISADGQKIGFNYDNHIYIIQNPLLAPQNVSTKPDVPESLEVITDIYGVYVNWAAVEEANYYRVYRTQETDTGPLTEIYETTELSLVVNQSIVSGTNYTFKVSAINNDGESQISEEKTIEFFEGNISPEDVVPPLVEMIFPSNNAIDVHVNTIITVSFSEPIQNATVDSSTFSLFDNGDNLIAGDFSFDGNDVIFEPYQELAYDALFEIVVSSTVTDLAGNSLGDTVRATFRTEASGSEGTLENPLALDLGVHPGFVDTTASYYAISDLIFQSSEVPVVWLENATDPAINLAASAFSFETEGTPFSCKKTICITSPALKEVFLTVDGRSTSSGATYSIRSVLAKHVTSANENLASSNIEISPSDPNQYILFSGLSANMNYRIAIPLLGDRPIPLRFLSAGLDACILSKLEEPENLACESKADTAGNILVDISSESILNMENSFTGIIEVERVFETDGAATVPGKFRYVKLIDLSPNTDYSIALQSPESILNPNSSTLSLYQDGWSTLVCEDVHYRDITTCEARSDLNGIMNLSIFPPSDVNNIEELFDINATVIDAYITLLTGNPFLGGQIVEFDNPISPVHYFHTNELSASDYAVVMSASNVEELPDLKVFSNDWLTPACKTVTIPAIGAFCLPELISDTRLNIKVSDGIDTNKPYASATEVDLFVLPLVITDITDASPYTETVSFLDFYEVYKIVDLPLNTSLEIVANINSTLAGNTFYVFSREFDNLLCTGRPTSSINKACTVNIIPSSDIYIVMDLTGVGGASYTIQYNSFDPD